MMPVHPLPAMTNLGWSEGSCLQLSAAEGTVGRDTAGGQGHRAMAAVVHIVHATLLLTAGGLLLRL
jgi:hypothetical protein